MILKRFKSALDRLGMKSLNENMDTIEKNFNGVVDVVANKAYNQVVDAAKLIWQEPVDTFADLATTYPNPEEGWTVMARELIGDVVFVYRYNGTEWVKIQQILTDAVNEVDRRLSTQLAHVDNKLKYESNADYPLPIPTYDGSNQTVHPDAIYIPSGFFGYTYWMAHTPYPVGNDDYENPSVVCSRDGVTFINPPGMTNPIFLPTSEQLSDGHHGSDAILIYREDLEQLECIWRWNKNGSTEHLYRQVCTDGKIWSEKELIFDLTGATIGPTIALSPTCVYENDLYKMWFVGTGLILYYTESVSGNLGTWSPPVACSVSNFTYRHWHVHVSKIDGLYHAIFNANKTGMDNQRVLLHSTSINGRNFNEPTLIMEPRKGEFQWDNQSLYRACLLKVNGIFKLYYSAFSTTNRFYIGISEGVDISSLRGSTNYNIDSQVLFNEIATNKTSSVSFLVNGRDKSNGAALLRMTSPDVLGIRNDVDTRFNDFEVRAMYAAALRLGSGTSRAYMHYDSVNGLHIRNGTDTDYINVIIKSLRTGEIRIIETGLGAVLFKLVEPDVLGVRNATDSSDIDFRAKHLKASCLVLDNGPVTNTEGAIRYNAVTKKHQGYDGTTWHDLY